MTGSPIDATYSKFPTVDVEENSDKNTTAGAKDIKINEYGYEMENFYWRRTKDRSI